MTSTCQRLCFAVIGVVFFYGCKSYNSGSEPSEDYLATDHCSAELERVNGGCGPTVLIPGDEDDWPKFLLENKINLDLTGYSEQWKKFDRKQFMALWERHREIILPKRNKVKVYTAHIHVTVESDQPQKYTFSYKLQGLDQPKLVKNFIVLSKMGFFDHSPLRYYSGLTWLLFGGTHETVNPYYYDPDPYTKQLPKYRPTDAGGRDFDRSGSYSSEREAQRRAMLEFESLVAPAENDTNNGVLRKIMGTKFGFSLYKTAGDESYDKLAEKAIYPVRFGELSARSKNRPQELIADLRYFDAKIITIEITDPKLDIWRQDTAFSP